MKLAISGTEIESNEPLDDLFKGAKNVGTNFVELWYPRNTGTDGFEATAADLERAGIRVACVSTGSELYRKGHSLKDQELLIKAIRFAGSVDAPFANTYFGYHSVKDDEAAIEVYRKLLEPCLKVAEENNVTIVLENEFNAFGVDPVASDITRRPESLRKLFESVDHPLFRSNFDACNFYCAGVEPFPYAYEMLSPYIGYVHVKDGCRYTSELASKIDVEGWRRFTDYEEVYVMRPLGEGAIPWSNIINRLQTDGYDGFLTLEPHAEIPLRQQAWTQSVNYIRTLIPE